MVDPLMIGVSFPLVDGLVWIVSCLEIVSNHPLHYLYYVCSDGFPHLPQVVNNYHAACSTDFLVLVAIGRTIWGAICVVLDRE
jgi:hypothetical protein